MEEESAQRKRPHKKDWLFAKQSTPSPVRKPWHPSYTPRSNMQTTETTGTPQPISTGRNTRSMIHIPLDLSFNPQILRPPDTPIRKRH